MVKEQTDLIFLDTETTGLDPDKHEIWEIAWAINDEIPVQERILVHSLKTADPTALEVNTYLEHHPQGARSEGPMVDLEVRKVLEGGTLVCANPTFDRMFMRKRWGLEPYHYRSIDVESMALAILEYDRPKGLKDIAEELRDMGYNIADPLHRAWIDVVVLRECYKTLRQIQKNLFLHGPKAESVPL
jgi:oligoribonuclease (3'-5' exoribonuclease)